MQSRVPTPIEGNDMIKLAGNKQATFCDGSTRRSFLQAGFLGNAGEWAHDIRGFVNNRTGLARMVANELYHLLPADRAVLIRRPLEKREWLLASPLPSPLPLRASAL